MVILPNRDSSSQRVSLNDKVKQRFVLKLGSEKLRPKFSPKLLNLKLLLFPNS